MMAEKMTVPNASVGADVEQSKICIKSDKSITNIEKKGNRQATKISKITEKNRKDAETSPETSGQDTLQTITMSELYDTIYAPRVPVVDGLINNGTYLFVGAPKVGKSFLMAQIGYCVSMGSPLWGHEVHSGTVLYLALEDDYARLQRRLSRMFGIESSEKFHLATRAKNLSEGLDQQLEKFVKEYADARLIIIDTLQKVREVGGDKFSYASDYEVVTKLKQFSDQYNICLLVVHHTRKMESSDSFDMISGTNGLLGAADGAFVMQKTKRTDNKANLEIVGRDQPDQKLELNFNRETCVWEFIKAETELWKEPKDTLLEAISELLTEEKADWIGSATELVTALEQPDIKPNALTRKLNINVERLINEYHISYECTRTNMGSKIKLTLNKE